MTASLRAARALALLAGFHLLGLALLAALAVTDWLLVTVLFTASTAYLVGGSLVASVMVAIPILRGMIAFLTAGLRRRGPGGVVVGERDQPELWALVRRAAAEAGTPPPATLVLTGEVNAGVSERARLLGLLAGPRTLAVGVPLLAGMTVPQIRGVLAHEFGHFAHHDTRLAAVTMRGRAAVATTVEAFHGGTSRAQALVGSLYVRYARFFLRSSQGVARRQELAADRAAASQVGPATMAAMLRRLGVLGAAHGYYAATWAAAGVPVGVLPPSGEVHGGFRRLLAARGPDGLAALAADRPARKDDPYDSHPPQRERLAALEALAPAGPAYDPDGPPALALLRDEDAVMAALEEHTLPAEAQALPRLAWPELVLRRSVADAEGWAAPLRKAVERARRMAPVTGRPTGAGVAQEAEAEVGGPGALPDLAAVLDAIDDGLLWMAVADRMPKPPQAARLTGASARNFIRPRIWDAVAGLLLLHLVGRGLAEPDTSWSADPGLVLPDAWEKGMDAAVDAALADTPDTAPLRALLAAPPDA
ncbi:M48 family metalloprotease [Streptomyces sp. NPDC020917]|uniref:M48 family metalloprotease n=1 Tax=Streptomyces sp. NPDC020917 TaxID=3365102 RepID=UPI0037AE7773